MAKKKSGINIRESTRGLFTAYCKRLGFGGVTQECIRRGLASDNPEIRRRAQFAKNARGWGK
jgi:hypothetical protein